MNLPIFLWLILIPLLASPVIYLVGRLTRQPRFERLPSWLATLFLFLATGLYGVAISQSGQAQAFTYQLGQVTLHMDGLGLLLAGVALVLGICVAIYSGPYLVGEVGQEKFYAMLTLMISTMIGLGCATYLFNLWIWFEAMAVTSYLLVAFYRQQPTSLEAGFKYLVQSAAGSGLVVIGIALVFGQVGSLNLTEIRAAAGMGTPSLAGLLAAGAFFVIGFGVKAALVPLHTWLPDAHSQAPSGISAMLSGVVIEAGLVALLRVLGALAGVSASWGIILVAFGAFNMFLGNLLALRQKQVKRLLAFSSLAHMGYMLLGLGFTFLSGQPGGAQGSFFHLINHAMMKGLAFLAAGALLYALYIQHGRHGPLLVSDLAGASRKFPLAAFLFSLAVLALGGLPPLSGFMSKWQIFVAGFQTHNFWLQAVVIFAALNSVLSLAYYAPLVNILYRHQPAPIVQSAGRLPVTIIAPLLALGLAVVIMGIWPSLANGLTEPAAQALMRMIR